MLFHPNRPRPRAEWKRMLEARVGIEPTDEGFADLSLTTWVPRPNEQYNQVSYGSIGNPRCEEVRRVDKPALERSKTNSEQSSVNCAAPATRTRSHGDCPA
jgi:hypothetical protein